ncbi:putative nitrogen fixation protein NifT [Derxia lacustris]|uniref:putative nitrogen fixation protein NifT n=1 Tax=Derxia lacustris TaxID=764842 RepID=UPI000A16FC48|nr:putative nitrogen fixation protein NifT [Derxia lacustris]
MKVMIRRAGNGVLSAYVPKKDLEEPIVSQEKEGIFGGLVTLANGWQLAIPEMPEGTTLPVTVEAKKLASSDED